MKPEEQIAAIAELDGKKQASPDYLNSLDAIIPVIRNQPVRVIHGMGNLLRKMPFKFQDIIHSPAQLCEALLRATRKWKD